jgi:hypothetical protein
MTAQSKTVIKTYFNSGDRPSEAQFADLIDSYQDANSNLQALASAGTGAMGLQLLATVTTAAAQAALGSGVVGRQLFATATTAAAQSAIGGGVVGRQIFECATTAAATSIVGGSSSGITLMAARSPTGVLTDEQTGIPSGVKRIVINFVGLAKGASTEDVLIQIGPSGGVATSGYTAGSWRNGSTASASAGIYVNGSWVALVSIHGSIQLDLVDSSTNTWAWHGDLYGTGSFIAIQAGTVTLSGNLTRILVTGQGGVPANFSAGSWQVSYE